jgi:hypothetical protein
VAISDWLNSRRGARYIGNRKLNLDMQTNDIKLKRKRIKKRENTREDKRRKDKIRDKNEENREKTAHKHKP